jgi:hypothetical protein
VYFVHEVESQRVVQKKIKQIMAHYKL